MAISNNGKPVSCAAMMRLPFSQVDVFSNEPFKGNAVAVVHDADALTSEQMQTFARWTNLSETTFLLRATQRSADYRLRIFTPGGELPFAGHPTLGSCHAWLAAGGSPAQSDMIYQECGAGVIVIQKVEQNLAFAAPPLNRTGPLDAAILEQVCGALSLSAEQILDHAWVDNGPGWCAVLLRDAQEVLSLEPDFTALGDLRLGVVGPWPPGSETQFELRAFAPCLGVAEDPVTGSLNASVAQWLMGEGRAPDSYVASQGKVIGRSGKIYLERSREQLWVGGATETRMSGYADF